MVHCILTREHNPHHRCVYYKWEGCTFPVDVPVNRVYGCLQIKETVLNSVKSANMLITNYDPYELSNLWKAIFRF